MFSWLEVKTLGTILGMVASYHPMVLFILTANMGSSLGYRVLTHSQIRTTILCIHDYKSISAYIQIFFPVPGDTGRDPVAKRKNEQKLSLGPLAKSTWVRERLRKLANDEGWVFSKGIAGKPDCVRLDT